MRGTFELLYCGEKEILLFSLIVLNVSKIKKRTRYTCTRIIIAIFPKNIFPWINIFWPVPCGLGGMVIFTSAGSEMRNGGRVPCTGVGKGGKSRLRNAWASFQGLWSLGKFPGGREMRRQTNGKESRERERPPFLSPLKVHLNYFRRISYPELVSFQRVREWW